MNVIRPPRFDAFPILTGVLFLALAVQAGTAHAQAIYTLAGSGDVMIDTGDGTAATTTYIHRPEGVVSDGTGNVYFSDASGSHRVRKVNLATGIITTVAGNGSTAVIVEGAPAVGAYLSAPRGVALDSAGNLYIADANNHRIRKVVAATGLIFTVAGNGTAAFSGDGGLATSASLNDPSGVAVDTNGNIYIADRMNGRIRRVDGASGVITTYAGNGTQGYGGDNGAATAASINFPNNLAVDSAGNVFIADTNNDRIRKVSVSGGVITTVAGTGTLGFSGDGGPAVNAQLSLPWGVSVDPAGNLFIADRNNMRIRRVSVGGTIQTVAGNGGFGFSGDGGLATASTLYAPYDVAVDFTGAVYIADTNNYRIRSFVPAGVTPQTINFPPFPVRTYLSGETLALSATASSGLTVIFSSTTPSFCTVTGTTLTLVANGLCTVAADQAGNPTYVSAPRVTQSLLVGPPVTGPAAFAFVDQANVLPGRFITSNRVTITGIPAPMAVSVTGGTYSIGCGVVFTSDPGTIADGQTVCLRHTSSLNPGVATDTVLAIGTTSDTFTSTTASSNATGLIGFYYRSVLRREADAGGLTFWENEAARMYALGANVTETWRSMSIAFFSGAEYQAFNRTDTEFVVDLYNTFFNRPPELEGISYWTGEIASGIPRRVILLSFLFSGEFTNYMQSIFGVVPSRPEEDMVVDFYRGFLDRLPDSAGYTSWVARFRAAQCTSALAVQVEADAISREFVNSVEYLARSRSNLDYVSDLYNAFMRRGADLPGVTYWDNQLNTLSMTREQVRQVFLGSPEFQARLKRVSDRGCT